MKISTKLGDSGTTKLWGIQGRVRKDHPQIEYLGTIDELQSYLGTLNHDDLDKIQRELYDLMCGIDVSPDWMDTEIPKQTEFILPKGKWHFARTICRRAERRAVEAGVDCSYLNRLSDYLYKIAIT